MSILEFLESNQTYAAAFVLAVTISLVATPVIIRVAKRFGVVDAPNHRKVQKEAIPMLGGVSVYLGMWVPILGLTSWNNQITVDLTETGRWEHYGVLAGAGLIVLVMGIIDDKRGLNAWQKLLVELPVAVVFATWVSHFKVINFPGVIVLELGVFSIPITVVWIIGITNALNLIDGIDGLATGVAMVIAMTNAALAMIQGNAFLVLVMLGLSGACLGFLRYNTAPARIYLGDGGSLFIGFTLATSSILASAKSHMGSSMLVAMIVLGYPIIDTLLAILRRSLLGRPVMSSDKGHIHHRLLQKGLSHRRAASILYLFTAGLSVLGLAIILGKQTIMLLTLLALTGVGILGLHILGFFKPFLPGRIVLNRPRFQIAHHQGSLIRAKMALVRDTEGILRLMEEACDAFAAVEMRMEIDPYSGIIEGATDGKLLWKRASVAPPNEMDNEPPESLIEMDLRTGIDGMRITAILDLSGLDDDLAIEYKSQLAQIAETAGQRIQRIVTGQTADWTQPIHDDEAHPDKEKDQIEVPSPAD